MENIGPAMAGWLKQAGIDTPEKLRHLGAIDAYLCMLPYMPGPHRMALYALYGAIHDINCLWLDADTKTMLNKLLAQAE